MKTSVKILFLLFLLVSCSEHGLDPKRDTALKLINKKLMNCEKQINSSLDQFSESFKRPILDSIAQEIFELVSSDDDFIGMYLTSPSAIYYSGQFDYWEVSAERHAILEDSTLNKEMRIGDIGYGKSGVNNGDPQSTSAGQLNMDNFKRGANDIMLVSYKDADGSATLYLFYKLNESFSDKFEDGNWGTSNTGSTFQPVKLEKTKNK